MDLNETIFFALVLYLLVKNGQPSCSTLLSESRSNGTICNIPKIEEGEPLDLAISNPAYLYLTVRDGEISKDTFKNVTPVAELWIMGENMTDIQPGAFVNLTNLNNLVVTNTSLAKLSRNTFAGMSNLTTLALNDNKISVIEDGAFFWVGKSATADSE
ncbi:hypothetical protein NQ317_010736 [Molorchus minor]|uniref:Uncharacterized protein n=1 Tax=Molorchus minor TaxID=1323400 RepID=A0ABQ9JF26_9CUCU|nr:hypothetical protein NQ317_010736 [Molorchus minor]